MGLGRVDPKGTEAGVSRPQVNFRPHAYRAWARATGIPCFVDHSYNSARNLPGFRTDYIGACRADLEPVLEQDDAGGGRAST